MKFFVTLGILGVLASSADAGPSMHNPFFCYATDPIRSMTYMGAHISSYEAIRRFNFTAVNPYISTCTPSRFWYLGRYGARFPHIESLEQMLDFAGSSIQDDIVRNYEAGRTTLCRQDFENIRDFRLDTDFERLLTEENASLLTESGLIAMRNIARRFQEAFPTIFTQNYSPDRFFFRHTNTERTNQSIRAFASGLFGETNSLDVIYEDVPDVDWLLRPIEFCPAFEEEIANFTAPRAAFEEGPEFTEMIEQINRKLGFHTSNQLDFDNIFAMWSWCRFKIASTFEISGSETGADENVSIAMAKTARRSVASVPLSPLSSEYIKSSGVSAQLPINPRIPSESIYTTNTSQKFNTTNNYTRPYSSNEFQNDSTASRETTFNSTLFDSVAAERERVRVEFYATYDVMTGVRIAATLGGFFGLMVFLVVYKSRGETQETLKALKDPKIAAVAAAVMQEEEDRELQQAMEATGMSIYPDEYEHIGFRRERLMSVGNVSAPSVLNRGYRFSSMSGGYSSLLAPQRRFSYSGGGRRSNSESSRVLSAYPMGGSFGIDDYFLETDGDEADDEFDQLTASVDVEKSHCLYVPTKGRESRRSSSITCCSTESSYLERRYSSVTLGLTPLPLISRIPSRRQSSTDAWDYSYPGIQIIQPTPKGSPCPSEKSVNEKRKIDRHKSLTQQDSFDCISEYPDEKSDTATTNNNKILDTSQVDTFSSQFIRRAPLASLSSFKVSSIDYQDSDLRSLGSDSVFAESYADTDDEMEQFSTDSDEISDAQSPPNTRAANKLAMASAQISVDVESIPLDCVKDVCETHKRNLLKSSSVHLVNKFETKAIIERQQNPSENTSSIIKPTRPASYSGCTTSSLSNYNKNSNQNKINKNKSSECVDINVVIVDNSSIVSPSVILELPVISTQEEENPPIDPSLPGPSRKWSKETLF